MINQCLMALPLVVLYEVSIGAVWLFGRKRLAGFETAPLAEKRQ